MKKPFLAAVSLMVLLTGCATTGEKSAESVSTTATAAESQTYLNQYPTRDRVDYVLNCVAKHGGLNFVNQYACGCKIDKIAEKLSFAEYEAATTYGFMSKVSGENGAPFRDAEQGKDLKTRLKEAEATAEKSCFVK